MNEVQQIEIDELIDRLLAEWKRVPDVATAFSTWDEIDQIDYLAEWQISEDDFERVAEAATAGILGQEAVRRYEHLVCLIEQHRPILDALMRADATGLDDAFTPSRHGGVR